MIDPRGQPWFDTKAWPFEARFAEVPGGRMHYVDEGAGDPVVLVHGTPGWSFEWREVIPRLATRHRVVAMDHLGFGLSDRPAGWTYALADHTANLRALLDQLGVQRFTLVVHDFGGPVGLPLALEGRATRLVLMNTWMWPLTLDPGFARQRWVLDTWLMHWMYRSLNFSARVMVSQSWGKRRPLTPHVHRHYTGMFPDAASRVGTVGFLRATYTQDEYLSSLWARRDALTMPTSIVWGIADNFIPQVHLDRWREALPRAEANLLEGVGHFPQEEEPAAVAAAVDPTA